VRSDAHGYFFVTVPPVLPMPNNPRDCVTRRIVDRAKAFPDVDLSPLETSMLDARDAALARAIDHAIARRWLTLAAVLDTRLDQSWSELQPTVQAPLLVGAAQLLMMDKLPDHAVINEAVEWTKANARRKAGGLVNAVLRRVASLRGEIISLPGHDEPLPRFVMPLDDGRAMMLGEDVFAEDTTVRLAQQTSHEEQLIRYWTQTHNRAIARQLAMHSLVHAPIILAGSELAGEPDLQPHSKAGFAVYTGPRDGLEDLLNRKPMARVQDPGTAVAMTLTSTRSPQRIIDLCAGRGTKTIQLMQLHPDAQIIACDIDPVRHDVLQRRFADEPNVEIRPFAEVMRLREHADLLVLDVPCSNTGVLARRVEAKYRFNAESLESIRDLQRQIVADAIALLSPDGCLLYATCSIEPFENQQQAEWIAHWHRMQIIASHAQLPHGQPGDPAADYMDGGYAALLRAGT